MALKGKQYKLDKNKDGKISGEDFKKMSKYKNGGPVKAATNRKVKMRGIGAATKGIFSRGPMG
jgi:hypothetical protein|tara:strand:+ start:1456 stop:1644 length:189 start_codon:yes stop_codon:yes gene_type:complete